MIPAFFSASWQWGDSCLPCPDKNSSTSVRREPNIGVRRSRTTMGDRCTPMPTMFSVPGGTPVGRGRRGISPAWLSGNSFSTERVPLGVRGAERPRKKREGRAQPGHGRRAAKPPTSVLGRGLPIPTRPRQPLQRGQKARKHPALPLLYHRMPEQRKAGGDPTSGLALFRFSGGRGTPPLPGYSKI